MSKEGIVSVLGCLLNRGLGFEMDTRAFADIKHDALVTTLVNYLNAHRHYLGYCHIEVGQALNDKGVDVILSAEKCRVGFQVKSHFDVTEDDFAAKVKRQFSEALSYKLDHYYILICSAMMKKGRQDYKQRVAHLLNEIRLFQGVNFDAFGPLTTIQYFREPVIVTRDELLKRKAITDDCLYDFEKGYEHLPEVDSVEIRAAQKHLAEEYGDEWWDDKDGKAAWHELQRLIQDAETQQFATKFLPTLPPEVQQKRADLIASIQTLLQECRKCKSWRDRSEYKLPQWLDHVEESMIPCTSLPNLLKLKDSVEQYLEVHREMDEGRVRSVRSDESDTSHVGWREGDNPIIDI